jgi:hypothetical protein
LLVITGLVIGRLIGFIDVPPPGLRIGFAPGLIGFVVSI